MNTMTNKLDEAEEVDFFEDLSRFEKLKIDFKARVYIFLHDIKQLFRRK